MNQQSDLFEDGYLNEAHAHVSINLNDDWRYQRLNNFNRFSEQFLSSSFDDQDWETVHLPHTEEKQVKGAKSTSTGISHCYRKRFQVQEKFEPNQQIYLYFQSILDDKNKDKDDVQMKIPAITIWLNQSELFSSMLPEPIDMTDYFRENEENLLVIYSKHDFRLRFQARLVLPRRLTGQFDFDEPDEDPKKRESRTLDYAAGFDDRDRMIHLFIHSVNKSMKQKQMNAKHLKDEPESDLEQDVKKLPEFEDVTPVIYGPIPRITIVILIVGTRGDVQPFIALAKRLLDYGHRVRLATHETFRKFVRENGIEFYPLAGNPADLMSFMVKNAGIVPSVSSIVAGDIAKSRRVMSEILASTWKACIEDDDETGVPFVAEAIIANPPSYGHIHCAQKLQIPLHIIFTMPWSPTVQFPHPLCKVDYNRAPADRINMLSYDLVEVLTWSGMRNIINEFRKETLGLPSLHTRQAVHLMMDEHVPHTYCWSPSLVPKPKDWASYIHVSGFFFLDLASNYKPSEELVNFLKAGDPPIYIGFGSITGHDAVRILQAVLEALGTTGYRGLLSGFEVDKDELPSNVLKIDNCPHDWLFQYVAAVCHHGGAGTTAAGLRAGKPTIIVPFFGDQFFWGSMVSKSGAGPAPMPGKTVTTKQFVEAFKFVHEPATQEAALKISINFQSEKGCEMAIRSFHGHLPLSKMRSDLEPSFTACFRLADYDLQISRPVAQVLVIVGLIQESDLKPHPTYGWYSLMQGNCFETFFRGIRKKVVKISHSVHGSKPAKNFSQIETKDSKRENYEQNSIERPFKDCLALYGEIKEKPDEEEEKKNNERSDRHNPQNLRYGLANLVVQPPISPRRNTFAATASIPAVNAAQKKLAQNRSNHHSPVKDISPLTSRKVDTKYHSKSNNREKTSASSRQNGNYPSLEEMAAIASGYSVEVCQKIIEEFEAIRTERFLLTENEKPKGLLRIPHALHKLHSRTTGGAH